MSRDRKGPRKVGLTSPRILVPAIVALVILVVVLWLAGVRGSTTRGVQEPTVKKTYAQFEDELREFELNDAQVRMYRDVIYVYPSGRDPYMVQDVSPEYTMGLLRKFMKTTEQQAGVDGIPQEWNDPTPMAYGLLVVVAVLPYLFLGWLTVMLVRAASGAADVDPDVPGSEDSPCPECSKPVPRDSRFCMHCAHPIQWTGGARQCPGCGQQTWKNDRFCRSCGKNLPAEARRAAEPAPAAAGPRPPAARPGTTETAAAPAPARPTAEIPTAGIAAPTPPARVEPEGARPAEPVRPPARPAAGRTPGPARPEPARASDPGRPAVRPEATPTAPASPPAPESLRSPLRPNRPPTPGPLPGEKP